MKIVVGDIIYHGGFTLTVNIDISLEVMGHSLAVPVMITARVTHLQGKAVVRIPPPPSVRIWFAFEREPTCEVDIDTAFGAAGMGALFTITSLFITLNSRKIGEYSSFGESNCECSQDGNAQNYSPPKYGGLFTSQIQSTARRYLQ